MYIVLCLVMLVYEISSTRAHTQISNLTLNNSHGLLYTYDSKFRNVTHAHHWLYDAYTCTVLMIDTRRSGR